MPKLTIDGAGTFDVPENKRLVLAMIDEGGIDQLHACGGNARCTTCRVEMLNGNPDPITQAEKDILTARGLINTPNLRLSCQMLCTQDMEVRAISRFKRSGRADAGKRPTDEIQPPAVWVSRGS